MKTRNLFLSLFAFAALCACNKENPEVPQVLGEDAYLSVRITTADADTKAQDGGFEVSTTENQVKNVLFAFFAADGTFMYTREITTFTWSTANTEDPNVEKVSNAQVVLDGKTIAPRQMVVVLNYTSDIKTAIESVGNLSGMYATLKTAEFNWEESSTTYFVMSNSSYWANNKNAFAAQIDESDIYKAGETPTAAQIVDVYVERVAAKLTATTSPSLVTTKKPLELSTGETIKYYPVIEGYAFTGTKENSYLCKNIEGLYNSINENWPGWNDPTNKRSYWGSSTDADLGYVDYDNVDNPSGHFMYCHENMSASKTKLIVKATVMQDINSDDDPLNDVVLDVVKVGATYYPKSDLETAIVTELNNAGVKISDAEVTIGNLKYVGVEGSGYKSKITLEGTITAEPTAAATIMAKYAEVLVWDDGKAYFFTAVEHLGNALTGTDYGVVRNHIYNLTVSKIAGLGTPYVPGIGGDGGDPVVPEEVDYELQAKINILKWKVVSQDVQFGE